MTLGRVLVAQTMHFKKAKGQVAITMECWIDQSDLRLHRSRWWSNMFGKRYYIARYSCSQGQLIDWSHCKSRFHKGLWLVALAQDSTAKTTAQHRNSMAKTTAQHRNSTSKTLAQHRNSTAKTTAQHRNSMAKTLALLLTECRLLNWNKTQVVLWQYTNTILVCLTYFSVKI